MTNAADFISTEQLRALTPMQKKVIDHISGLGIALVKVDRNEEASEFLVSYKIRENEIELARVPITRDPDDLWRLLALHLEARSQVLN